MLVKLTRAHRYVGPRGEHKRAASRNRVSQVGEIIDVEAAYFEKHIEPYGGIMVPSIADDKTSGVTEAVGKLNANQLRHLAIDLSDDDAVEAIEGSGAHGRLKKSDLIDYVLALDKEDEIAEALGLE